MSDFSGKTNSHPQSAPVCQFFTVKDVAARYRVSVATIWRWVAQSKGFPRPIQLSAGATRWRLADLDGFDAQLAAQGARHV